MNAASLSGFITWAGIAISHYRFRQAYLRQGKNLSELPYVARGYPYSTLCVMTLCLVIIAGQNYKGLMASQIDWRIILVSYIGVPIFLILWLGYKLIHKTKLVPWQECNFEEF